MNVVMHFSLWSVENLAMARGMGESYVKCVSQTSELGFLLAQTFLTQWPFQHAYLMSFILKMYFNSTLTDSSKLLKPLLVFTFIICGIICGLTRITQYKNHPVDVYCGFLIGGGIALYLVNNILTYLVKCSLMWNGMHRIFCTIITYSRCIYIHEKIPGCILF